MLLICSTDAPRRFFRRHSSPFGDLDEDFLGLEILFLQRRVAGENPDDLPRLLLMLEAIQNCLDAHHLLDQGLQAGARDGRRAVGRQEAHSPDAAAEDEFLASSLRFDVAFDFLATMRRGRLRDVQIAPCRQGPSSG